MMELSKPGNQIPPRKDLVHSVLSWSIQDILNTNLYKNKVKKIPHQFSSTSDYFNSFVDPLMEETHADLYSRTIELPNVPATHFSYVEKVKDVDPPKELFYKIAVNKSKEVEEETANNLGVGDLIFLTDSIPEVLDDLEKPGKPFIMAFVENFDYSSSELIVRSSKPLQFEQKATFRPKLFAIFLINMTTYLRIWNALLSSGNLNIIKKILKNDWEESLNQSSPNQSHLQHAGIIPTSFKINDSQKSAILSCIPTSKSTCDSQLNLIWGPPGTGKTKTIGSLLFILLKLKHRTLTCAPTNTAVREVTCRLLQTVSESNVYETYGFGDIVIFGNAEKMKITHEDELIHIFLDHRASMLSVCFAPLSGWVNRLNSMTDFLKDPTTFISTEVVKEMIRSQILLGQISSMLKDFNPRSKYLKIYSLSSELRTKTNDCLQVLTSLRSMFTAPQYFNTPRTVYAIKMFCLRYAMLVFSTASNSIRLQTVGMTPIEFLVIDEAAQLKECESSIPLQLPGLRYAVLIGDEKQLPAMVKSKISEEAGFGKSLFERLVVLGHKRHLLNIQYRMHPSISIFPKTEFYDGKIIDAPNVLQESYKKNILSGKMYGSFSFINIEYGREQLCDNQSTKNMVEVAVVTDLVERLFKESVSTKQKISIGVISPYNAQVFTLQEILGEKYSKETESCFSVNVRSVDGYQGGEDDVIIISTVRSNQNGSIGFLSNLQRANVALTRARYNLWVLGSGSTLLKSGSVWNDLVTNAKHRDCFFEANNDKSLARAIIMALLSLNQVDDLLDAGSSLFLKSRWKVFYGNKFWKSLANIQETETQSKVLLLLDELSLGLRHPMKEKKSDRLKGISSEILKVYDINGVYNLVWAVDTITENSSHLQVLKIWDVSPFTKLPTLARQLKEELAQYSAQNIYYCTVKRMEGNVQAPVRWLEESDEEHSISSQLAYLGLSDAMTSKKRQGDSKG